MNLTVAIAITLVFVVLGWRRPRWAVAGIVVGLPAYLLKTELLGVSITALEAGILGLVAGYAIRSTVRTVAGQPVLREHWQQVQAAIPRPMLWALVVTTVGWVIATAGSIDRLASLAALKSWLLEPLLVGLIVIHELRDERGESLIRRSFLLALCWVVVAGFFQLAFLPGSVEDGRLSSVFTPVANYFAMFAAPLVVLAAGWILQHRDRGWSMFALIVGLVALVVSHSYGGMLAVLAGFVILAFTLVPSNQRRQMLAWLGAGIIVFSIAQIGSPYLREKINFSSRSSSLVRTEIWTTAIEIGRQHPVIGIGPDAFEVAYREVAPVVLGHAPLEWLVAKPHNLYLNLWVETGLLGLFGMLLALGLFLRRTLGQTPATVYAAAVMAMLAHGLVDTPIFKNDLAVMTVIIIVMGLLSQSRQTKN